MADSRFFHYAGPFSLAKLAEIGNATLHNTADAEKMIADVAPLDAAQEEAISFFSNTKYQDALKASSAGACVLHPDAAKHASDSMALLTSDNPYAAYARIAAAFYPASITPKETTIAPSAYIDDTASIGENCQIAPGAYIGPHVCIGNHVSIGPNAALQQGVVIGANTTISANVTISHSIIGEHVVIHPGTSIGQDGFGFAQDRGVHLKVPQLGRVIIEDHVEIGANCCIDRGAGPDTIIGRGSKLDNLVQVAHNATLGQGCIMVAQSGVSGSSTLGNYVVLGGQVGVAGHLSLGDGVQAAGQSGVVKDCAPGSVVGGTPAVPIKQWHRQSAALKKLVTQRLEKNDA